MNRNSVNARAGGKVVAAIHHGHNRRDRKNCQEVFDKVFSRRTIERMISIEYVCPECDARTTVMVHPIIPAKVFGPPESCHPEEGGEIEPEECADCGHPIDAGQAQEQAGEEARDRREADAENRADARAEDRRLNSPLASSTASVTPKLSQEGPFPYPEIKTRHFALQRASPCSKSRRQRQNPSPSQE